MYFDGSGEAFHRKLMTPIGEGFCLVVVSCRSAPLEQMLCRISHAALCMGDKLERPYEEISR